MTVLDSYHFRTKVRLEIHVESRDVGDHDAFIYFHSSALPLHPQRPGLKFPTGPAFIQVSTCPDTGVSAKGINYRICLRVHPCSLVCTPSSRFVCKIRVGGGGRSFWTLWVPPNGRGALGFRSALLVWILGSLVGQRQGERTCDVCVFVCCTLEHMSPRAEAGCVCVSVHTSA